MQDPVREMLSEYRRAGPLMECSRKIRIEGVKREERSTFPSITKC